jgi:probable addiction module antidote protein
METDPWEAPGSPESDEEMVAYLESALEEGDPDILLAALEEIAEAKGMTEIARAAGLGRATLYKALADDWKLEFRTVTKVLQALGFRLKLVV